MNTKIFNRLFIPLALAAAAVSCTDEVKFGENFIEKAPGGTVNFDTIFSKADYANQFLTAIYARQYYGLPYNSDVCNSASQWVGKFDGLTDIYQIHWEGCALYYNYYTGTLNSSSQPLMSFTNDLVWDAVRQVWLLVENIDRVPDLSDDERNYMVAQAKALLASRYFDLVPFYGGLPIVDHAFTGSETTYEYPRATFEETIEQIVAWIDEAIPYLPWAYNGNTTATNSSQTGRCTKAGAMALKAKVLWFAASPMFNATEPYFGGASEAEQKHLVWYGDFRQERWERALKACEDFFTENENNGNFYHLLQAVKATCDSYRIAYRQGYILDDSPENIHWVKVADFYGSQGTYKWLNWNWSVRRLCYHPSNEYIEMFPWSDGKPFKHDTDMKLIRSYTATDESGTEYPIDVYQHAKLFYEYKSGRVFTKTATRDPRLYENTIVSGQPLYLNWQVSDGKSNGRIMETWVGGQDAAFTVKDANGLVKESLSSLCSSGFAPMKYVLNANDYQRNYNMHWNVLTIPDMILMYAECLAQCGRLSDAIKQVDLVRSRVGLKSINSSWNKDKALDSNKDNLIEEILRERACELGMTNARYFDMVRYKRTDWMVKQLHGMATYRMIKNAKNEWVRRNVPYVGDDQNSDMEEPTTFEYEYFDMQTTRRALWGKDPDSQEVKKWLMAPFPINEINKGYGLIQNPGW